MEENKNDLSVNWEKESLNLSKSKEFKIYTIIKEHTGALFVSLVCFIATILWSFFSNHLLSTYYSGYLSFFQITSYYEIESINSPVSFSISLLYFIVFLSMFVVPNCINILYNKLKTKKVWRNRFYHFMLYFFINLFLSISFISYYIWIETRVSLTEIAGFIIQNFLFIAAISLLMASAESVVEISDFSSAASSLKRNLNKKAKIILSLLSLIIIPFIIIFFINSFYFSLGATSAISRNTYPSFTKDNIEYIIIAKTKENYHLTISLPSLQDSTVETVCVIQDITNIPLIDKDINGIFPNE